MGNRGSKLGNGEQLEGYGSAPGKIIWWTRLEVRMGLERSGRIRIYLRRSRAKKGKEDMRVLTLTGKT